MPQQQLSRLDVEAFLDAIRELVGVPEALVVDRRSKNLDFMAAEGLKETDVACRLSMLTVEQYMHNEDDRTWFVFAQEYRNVHGVDTYIYIKVRMSVKAQGKVICLSFHEAERNPVPYLIYKR